MFIVAALSGYKDIKELYSTSNHKKVHLSNLLVAEGLLLIMTFLCAVLLMMFEFFVYQYRRRGRYWHKVVTILIAATGMMLIMANTVLVIVTNRNNTALSVILVPVLVLVCVSVLAGAWMEEEPRSTPVGGRYDKAMKGTFEMATIGTMASFALQGTIAFGYLKTPDSGKRDPPLDLAVCYATSTFTLTTMMICAMPLILLPDNMLEDLIRVVERLRHAVLAALAMMALVVSVEFLEGFVVLSVCPEAVAVVLYYAVQFFSPDEAARGESSPWMDFAFRIVAAVGFTLITGLYAAFLGTDHYSLYLKAAMSILLLAVLSSLSRLAIQLDVPEVGGAGAIEMGVAGIVVVFPAAALLASIPLVLKDAIKRREKNREHCSANSDKKSFLPTASPVRSSFPYCQRPSLLGPWSIPGRFHGSKPFSSKGNK